MISIAIINEIISQWGLTIMDIRQIVTPSMSTWQVNEEYYLKKHQDYTEARRNIEMMFMLRKEEIPVAEYITTLQGDFLYSDAAGGYYSLCRKALGEHRDLYVYPELAYPMGTALGKLHKALLSIDKNVNVYESNIFKSWEDRIRPDVAEFLPLSMITSIDTKLKDMIPLLEYQLIHRDVHMGNVLFDKDVLSTWLDFDIAQKNVRIFDIAYLLSGLLVGNLENPEKINIWSKIREDTIAGYHATNTLTKVEKDALDIIIVFIELLFVSYNKQRGDTAASNVALDIALWYFRFFIISLE